MSEELFSPILKKLNISQMNSGAFNALLGEAHQYLVTGILMRLGFLVSVITVRAGVYDIILPAFEDFPKEKEKKILLRVQVRTVRDSLKLTAGTRGGVDRYYRSGVKEYKYTPKDCDLIIGIDRQTLDLYFVPTRFIGRWGKSVSKRKLEPLKNNVEILLNWNKSFLRRLEDNLHR